MVLELAQVSADILKIIFLISCQIFFNFLNLMINLFDYNYYIIRAVRISTMVVTSKNGNAVVSYKVLKTENERIIYSGTFDSI